jgi:hypothetical protein
MKSRFSSPTVRPAMPPLVDRARMPWRFLARHVTVDGLRR